MKPAEMFTAQRRVIAAVARMSQPICRKYELNQSCFDILMFIANNEEYNTARDICSIRGIKPGLASVAVETLIQRGLLVREDDPSDRRVKRLVPTYRAQPIVAEGRSIHRSFIGKIFDGVSTEEMEVYKRVTDKISRNIEGLEKGEI